MLRPHSSPCRAPFLSLPCEGISWGHSRVCSSIQPHISSGPWRHIALFVKAGSPTQAMQVFHLLLLCHTAARTDCQDPCQHWLPGVRNHLGSLCPSHWSTKETVQWRWTALGLHQPQTNLKLLQAWPSSQIFLNPHHFCHKWSWHSLKYKHGPLYLFNLLLPHLGKDIM